MRKSNQGEVTPPKSYLFRAYNTKKQQPVTLRPCEDSSGYLFTGQGEHGYYELLTEEEKKELRKVIDYHTKVIIQEGTVLSEKDPVTKDNIKWILKHPYITLKYQKDRSRDAVFYVDDPEYVAEIKTKKDKLITMAKSEMYKASQEAKIRVAKAFGNIGAESMSLSSLEDYLSIKCEDSPELINELFDPKAKERTNAMGLFEDLKRFNIVRKFGGVYRFGGVDGSIIGKSQEEAVNYIMDSANEETVLIFMQLVDEKKV